jgi:hypothetical protein
MCWPDDAGPWMEMRDVMCSLQLMRDVMGSRHFAHAILLVLSVVLRTKH